MAGLVREAGAFTLRTREPCCPDVDCTESSCYFRIDRRIRVGTALQRAGSCGLFTECASDL